MRRKPHFTGAFAGGRGIVKTPGNNHFSDPPGVWEEWTPGIDIFGYSDRVEIYVDLAGVSREEIELSVTPYQIAIRGYRRRPGAREWPRLTLAMEIETGRFSRCVQIPLPVEPESVTARQENGLLCIQLPLVVPGRSKGGETG